MVTVMEPLQTVRPQSPPEPLEPAANETEKLQVMIDVREVDFTYGDHKVLHNISLQMPPRAVTAFIGPVRRRQDDSAALHKSHERSS